jgi:predicted transcriptional regulator
MIRKISAQERQKALRRNEKKWTKTLMDAGYTVIPSVIIERQKTLGLSAVDVNILLHLASFWWFSDNPPHPSKRLIAESMRIDASTVRRHIAAMEGAGLIERKKRIDPIYGQQTNYYLFDGLIRKATPLALEATQKKLARQREDAASRAGRKKLRLVASKSDLHES